MTALPTPPSHVIRVFRERLFPCQPAADRTNNLPTARRPPRAPFLKTPNPFATIRPESHDSLGGSVSPQLHRVSRHDRDAGRTMPSRFPVARRFESFDHTFAQLMPRLQRMRTPHQLMAALRWGMDELDRTLAESPASVRAAVACRSGCDSCCHVPVDVLAHEILFAADHILTQFAPVDIEPIIARLAAHRGRVAAFAVGERDRTRQPCALLVAGACSIYAGRPQPCRNHHTSDAAVCAAHLADPSVDITRVYIPALRARMFAVSFAVDEAIEAAGYDERAYDFGSGLHEALTNSGCLDAWLRHQSAFPDSCLAYPAD